MAESNGPISEGQEKRDREHRPKAKTEVLLYDQLGEYKEGSSFQSLPQLSASQHATLLAHARSGEQQTKLVIGLQKMYGNAYVQRVLERISLEKGHNQEELPGRPLASDGEISITRYAGMAGVIARTPTPASSRGTITISPVTRTSYNIRGNTLSEVATQLDPVEWGRCTWQWSYSHRTTEGVTDRVNIRLRLAIRLPRWRGRGWNRASAAVKAEWNRMLECLRAHENHHAETARSWAPMLQERLFNQPESDLDTAWNDGLAEHQSEQDSYDSDTTHGETEGVSLDTSIV